MVLTGASSGIGEAAAELFAHEGATVVVVARRQDLLEAVAQRITAQGGSAFALPCNLSDLAAVDDLVKTVEDRIGGVDILVNNAGRSIRRPLAESLDRWHDVERTMTLNYYSPLRLIRGFAPGMFEQGDGHIINVSSTRSRTPISPHRPPGRAAPSSPSPTHCCPAGGVPRPAGTPMMTWPPFTPHPDPAEHTKDTRSWTRWHTGIVGYSQASSSSRQARSQRRQDSAQTRQCGIWACRSHSSPQLWQMAAQRP